MIFLIVDLNIKFDGHKFGFVQETLNWTLKKPEHEFYFLVNQKLIVPHNSNVRVEILKKEKEQHINAKSPFKKYKEQWSFIKQKAQEFNAAKVILMEFDIYQLAIGTESKLDFDIDGIWFRPYHRQIHLNESFIGKIKFNLNHIGKKLTFRFALRNKHLKKVFVLNDKETVNVLNQKFGIRLFYLPDPVFEIENNDSIDIHSKFKLKKDQLIFLLFGYMDERKNVINLIEAYRNLPENYKSKITLLLIGLMSPEYNDYMLELENDCGNHIIKNNAFVSDAEMNAVFKASDLILKMNVNFFASSGILGMAAKHNKPSIVSDYGVVADLTKEYKLGQMTDPLNVSAITKLYKDFVDNKQSWDIDGQPYYHDHNTDAFAGTLLGI